jgi:hypothetical protein
MAEKAQLSNLDMQVGAFTCTTISGVEATARAVLKQQDGQVYPIDPTSMRIWNSGAVLPNTAAADDLGLISGTFGTNVWTLQTIDQDDSSAATSAYARFQFSMPPEYVAGETVELRIKGGMITTVADTTATVDAVIYEYGADGAKSGSDLCATAAQTINTLISSSVTTNTFTVTATTSGWISRSTTTRPVGVWS